MTGTTLSKAVSAQFKNVEPEVLITADQLASKYGPVISLDGLAEILSVKRSSLLVMISREQFRIPITKIGGKWTSTAFSVAQYLFNQKVQFGHF